jgi:L-cysteine S-thiosulfotransferase
MAWRHGMALAICALMLDALSGGLRAQQCRPKTTGYFQQMTSFAQRAPSPSELVGIVNSLTGAIGDPARGRSSVMEESKGNCLACHRVPVLSEAPSHGDLGPNLSGVGGRYTESQLRQIIVDPKVLFPNTLMPAFHIQPDFQRVPQSFAGQTVLSASEVEDVVAFLKTLR